MNREYVEANALVERYVQSRLPPDLEQAFEAYLLDDEDVREEVELHLIFKRGLRELAARSLHENWHLDSGTSHPRARLAVRQPWRAAGVVATLTTIVLVVANLAREEASNEPPETVLLHSNIAFITLAETRAAASRVTETVTWPGENASLVLRLLLDHPDYDVYRVTLSDARSGKALIRVDNVPPVDDGELRVLVGGDEMRPNTYSVHVEGIEDGTPRAVTRLEFAVRLDAPTR